MSATPIRVSFEFFPPSDAAMDSTLWQPVQRLAEGRGGAGSARHGDLLDKPNEPQPVKPLPAAASWASSGAGVQNFGSPLGLAAKPFISSITWGRPSMSAYSMGPPR